MAGVHWYVQTRGTGLRQDYTWVPVAAGHGDPTELAQLRAHGWRGHTLAELAGDDEHPGLVLAHAPSVGTVVYVTGLRPTDPQPVDAHGRAIRAAVIGLARPGTDPRPVWQLAITALRGRLDARLGLSHDQPDDPGFTVDAASWPQGTATAPPGPPQRADASRVDPTSILERPRVDRDADDERERVAEELAAAVRSGRLLPPRETVIVLRRSSIDQTMLASIGPRRALTQVEPGSGASRSDSLDLLAKAGRQAAGGLHGIARMLPWLVVGLAATVALVVAVVFGPVRL
jgi:hypothetical protein